MPGRSLPRRVLGRVNQTLEQRTAARRVSASVLARAARWLGADAEVADEIRTGWQTRTIDRSEQMAWWAIAVARGDTGPNSFQVGDHIASSQGRRAAASALRRRLEVGDDALMRRQLIHVDDALTLREICEMVREDVQGLLGARAVRPAATGPLEPHAQLAIISRIIDMLKPLGVRPFLMSGTLLGPIRDGHFLAHDYDIDLGLMPGVDVEAVAAQLSASEDFEVEVIGSRIVAVDPAGIRTDVFAHVVRAGLFWHETLVHEWWNTPFDLVPFDIEGTAMWIPSDSKRYLDENYGSWDHSVAFYDISFDTPNRRYRQTREAIRFLHSRCVIGSRTGDRWLVESAVRELNAAFGIDASQALAPSLLIDRPRDD